MAKKLLIEMTALMVLLGGCTKQNDSSDADTQEDSVVALNPEHTEEPKTFSLDTVKTVEEKKEYSAFEGFNTFMIQGKEYTLGTSKGADLVTNGFLPDQTEHTVKAYQSVFLTGSLNNEKPVIGFTFRNPGGSEADYEKCVLEGIWFSVIEYDDLTDYSSWIRFGNGAKLSYESIRGVLGYPNAAYDNGWAEMVWESQPEKNKVRKLILQVDPENSQIRQFQLAVQYVQPVYH